MLSYFFLLIVPCILSFLVPVKRWPFLIVALCSLFFVFFIGLRHEVGGDWEKYLILIEETSAYSTFNLITNTDPSYFLLNKLFGGSDLSIYLINSTCAAFLMVSTLLYIRRLPRPFLALSLAVPYLIIVVGMGYTRQATAIGLSFLVIQELLKNNFRKSLIYFFLAMSFHSSAIISTLYFVPTLYRKVKRNPFYLLLIIPFISFSIYIFMPFAIDYVVSSYIYSDSSSSSGALPRIMLISLYALTYIIFKKHFQFNKNADEIWMISSYFIFLLLALVLVLPLFSTLYDRFSLYMLPLLVTVGSYIPSIRIKYIGPAILTLILHIQSFLYLFVWFTFASHSEYWLPYKNILMY